MNTPEDEQRIAKRYPEDWPAVNIWVDAEDYLGNHIRGKMTGNGAGRYTGVIDEKGKIHACLKRTVKPSGLIQ